MSIPSTNGQNSELNINAKEFVPNHSNNNDDLSYGYSNSRAAGSSNGSSSSSMNHRKIGTVPKRFSNHRNNQRKFYPDNQRNWRENGNSERRHYRPSDRNGYDENQENRNERNRKFFRDNESESRNERRNKFKITIRPQQSANEEGESKIDSEQKVEPEKVHRPNNSNQRRRQHRPSKKSSISQREQLMKEIERNTLECMICCEKIRNFQPIWSCKICFNIVHLHCIKMWMKKSKEDGLGLRCVACNQQVDNNPRDYFCFCGKVKNPTVNRHDLAHSCGQQCGNTADCEHPCTLNCHPGKHATCHAVVNKFCGCGKTSKSYQCSMKAEFQCDNVCEKTLNCQIHKCKDKCHQGHCQNCPEELECKCFCGSETKKLPCTVENVDNTKYSCENDCGKILNCGNHKCSEKCHDKDCKPCGLLPEFIKTCPCKRMTLKPGQRVSCDDPIPLCGNICKKPLRCGSLSAPHLCPAQCHLGECPPCEQTSKIKCRCGRKEEKIPCKELLNSDLRCKKKCTKFKSCGRHRCNIECCIEIDHTCQQNCNRMLDCNKHKCQKTCHIGNCPPCHRVSFDELTCECGRTVVYPPVKCGTEIRDCSNKCTRRHNCQHPPSHNCHSEPECPPCVFLTTKFCYGKHEERKTIPCSQDSFSCGMPCGKMLKCVRHNCIKICHQGDCEKTGEVCTQKCAKKRIECDHNCGAKCHDGECPDTPCRERIQVTCLCGNLKSIKTCEQVEYENRKLQRVKLASQQNDEASTLTELLGDFKKTTKILDCNDECKIIERNRRLDIAFKVQNPTLATTPKFTPAYSDHVRLFYKKDPAFVNMVHEKLTELVKLAKETKNTPYRCHSFPSMNRDKRHVIHDMGEMFGVETKAFDAEPNRNIVATAVREYCWLPSMSIAEVIQRENGARRPPMNQLFK